MLATAFFIYLIVSFVAFILFTKFFLGAPKNLSSFDQSRNFRAPNRTEASPENEEVISDLRTQMVVYQKASAGSMSNRVSALRTFLDGGMSDLTQDPDELGVKQVSVNANGVAAEWIYADNSNPDKRLMYIHGGAFMAGSPLSHRRITSALAKLAGISVLVIDYRLLPEHHRASCINDCETAYKWMLENGPNTKSAAQFTYVSGDSAGGNLTLVMIALLRDKGVRQVDAAIALSPITDSTLSSPSMKSNIKTDLMLGKMVGQIMKIPEVLRLIVSALTLRLKPNNPLYSPLFGDLSNLPPTLIHASECEVLIDDCVRYTNKAKSQGSPVSLQTWPGMIHVWQFFIGRLPEAEESLQLIAEFIKKNSSPNSLDKHN